MKKEDQFQSSKEELINQQFEMTRRDQWKKQDPLTAQMDAAKELNELNQQRYEREQATKEATAKAEREEIENLKRRAEEAEKKLKQHSGE
jgi:hypothetical protein